MKIDKPNVARDGAPKNIAETIPTAHGMKNRTAEHSLMPGFSNPLDDEKMAKLPPKEGHKGTQAPPHPSSFATMTPEHRGTHKPGEGSRVLNDAANLGKPVINDKDNGRAYDGGSRPVTTRD
jgi:hypothetical protein